jgi:hypothetical protein
MERCPCCNARLRGAALCSRCQSDLGPVLAARQAAKFWLSKSLQYWQDNKPELSLAALNLSLHLHKTRLALLFRDFLIHQTSQKVLHLLVLQKLLPAKQQLFRMHKLLPYSRQLQQLHWFTEYLLVKKSQ